MVRRPLSGSAGRGRLFRAARARSRPATPSAPCVRVREPASDPGLCHPEFVDAVDVDGERIAGQRNEVGPLSWGHSADLVFYAKGLGGPDGIGTERLLDGDGLVASERGAGASAPG